MQVQALLFDTFGTVVDWRTSVIAELTRFGADRALSADWPALADAWRCAYAPSMNRVRRGEQPWTLLDDLHRQSLAELLPRFGLALDAPAIDHLALAWRRLDPWPDSVPGLARLRTRHTIAPLSNGNVALLTAMAKRAGLPWDLVLGSDLFRHFKPDSEVYLGACALLCLQPGEVMMCAAHNADLGAARALGLRTAFIARPTEHGPGQSRDLAPESDWDHAVDSIEALAAQLGC